MEGRVSKEFLHGLCIDRKISRVHIYRRYRMLLLPSFVQKSLFAVSCLVLAGCTSSSETTLTRFHDDGRAKPILALTPVIDRTDDSLPWNLSEELTYAIYNRLIKNGNFWIDSISEIARNAKKVASVPDPFGADVHWSKEEFKNYEFVAFIEIAEHDIHPRPLKGNFLDAFTPACELDVSIRLRVVDCRGKEPKIILNEVVENTYMMPKQDSLIGESNEKWKQKTYAISPLGFAHHQLSKEIVARIEDYIMVAKSK